MIISYARGLLNRFQWTDQELFAYEREHKRVWDNQAALDYQFDAGFKEGFILGLIEALEKNISQIKRKAALDLLKVGASVQVIVDAAPDFGILGC